VLRRAALEQTTKKKNSWFEGEPLQGWERKATVPSRACATTAARLTFTRVLNWHRFG
jgi:hypothetical protein